jgi:hypothetical protein
MIVGGFLLALLSVALSRIIMVQELFRHGARYPIYSTMDNYSIYAKQDKVEGNPDHNFRGADEARQTYALPFRPNHCKTIF